MSWEERIPIDPEVLGGKPVIKVARVPVQVLVGSLSGGMTKEEVCREYYVTRQDIQAALGCKAERKRYH